MDTVGKNSTSTFSSQLLYLVAFLICAGHRVANVVRNGSSELKALARSVNWHFLERDGNSIECSCGLKHLATGIEQ